MLPFDSLQMLLLYFLLPVAAASGWWAAKRSETAVKKRRTGGVSADYYKGLNFLLNEQPDKAIEVFIRILEVDSETVEVHLALGNLFRRRGEVDRAIRIHQNLIARPNLRKGQREEALFELGQDYLSAGLFDRAESLFQELIDANNYVLSALKSLLAIYQQEKEWDKAIDTARKLENLGGGQQNLVVAHYYCELVEQALEARDMTTVQRFLKRAMAIDRNSVRASLLEGRIAQDRRNYKAAIPAYQRIARQDREYLPIVVDPLIHCFQQIGRPREAIDFLRQFMPEHTGGACMLALTDLLVTYEGEGAAMAFLQQQLGHNPTLQGLVKLIELETRQGDDNSYHLLRNIKPQLDKLLQQRTVFRCVNCGFKAKTLHWLCPGCKRWGTVKPKQPIEVIN